MNEEVIVSATSSIVAAAISADVPMPPGGIADLIDVVSSSLWNAAKNQRTREAVAIPNKAPKVANSIPKNKTPKVANHAPENLATTVTCKECGFEGKLLKRHILAEHGMSVAEYVAKHKLASEKDLIAPNYALERSRIAIENKLGRMRNVWKTK